jgi:hypothetical protein
MVRGPFSRPNLATETTPKNVSKEAVQRGRKKAFQDSLYVYVCLD